MSLQQRCHFDTDPIYLIDGTAFVYRAFYANRTLQRADGFPTGAVYVITRLLLRLLREERPSHAVFFMDGKGPHFRHTIYPLYKANREATPEELLRQIEPVQRIVCALGLCLEVPHDCEADDGIASLAARYCAVRPVVIMGADKDLRQCLTENVLLWDPASGSRDEKIYTAASFIAESGLHPEQWADVQAVTGDSSDNIPGIPGIGPKTAAKIFAQFATLEALRDGLPTLAPKLRDKIAPHMDDVFRYRELTRLDTTRCTHLNIDAMTVRPIDMQAATALMREFELYSLVRELESLQRAGFVNTAQPDISQRVPNPVSNPIQSRQGSLFDAATTPPPSAPFENLPLVDTPAALPPCHNVPVALLPCALLGLSEAPEGMILAVGQHEVRTTLPVETLVPLLAQAVYIATPDVKWLLRHHPAFAALHLHLWFDLGLAAYVCNPEERDYDWPRLVRPLPQAPLLAGHGQAALTLAATLAERLHTLSLDTLYRAMELPIIPVLAAMEEHGVAIDSAALTAFLAEVHTQLNSATQHIYALAGGPFNIRSSRQLGDVLFRTLKLPTAGKTAAGQLSTAQPALEKLAGKHALIDAVLEYRTLEKLRSTYLEPLPKLADAQGRIHTTFNQKATATGRLSSSNPNLQNIPVRGHFGQRMRSCFVAAPGMALISADYSQIELRVLAHMSQDPVLLDAFAQGQDIHTRTAALIFGIAPQDVNTAQRRNAKTINFGLIYGMGAQKLAQELHLSLAQAKAFIANYFAHLTQLKRFYESVEAAAKEQGHVLTLAGRRRLLPDIHSPNQQLQALARRQAINTVIQGSAADIIKLAMLAVAQDQSLRDAGARLILQVHDELLLEAPVEYAHTAGERVAALMCDVQPTMPLTVPLLVDWGVGHAWSEAH